MQAKPFPVLLTVLAGLMIANVVLAVPPPDFLFSLGSQISQFLSLVFVVLTAVAGTVYMRFRLILAKCGIRYLVGVVSVCLVIIISLSATYFYHDYLQKKMTELWLQKQVQIEQSAQDNLDQLTFSESSSTEPSTVSSSSAVISPLPQEPTIIEDDVSVFIRKYYAAIAGKRFSEAYEMSKKSVSFATFKSWYTKTDAISIGKLQRINETSSSLELTLAEGPINTRYAVVMEVRLVDGKPIQIEKSTVRILGVSSAQALSKKEISIPVSVNSLKELSELPLPLTDAEFESLLINGLENTIVLDAREDIEYELGHLPESVHIRFADLKAGRWVEIPEKNRVVVLCWSGIRGKEVAEFLRSKNLLAQYLQNGANGWVSQGGRWQGQILFSQSYTDAQYRRVFSKSEVEEARAKGVILVDARPPKTFASFHVSGSINISLMSTPSIELPKVFDQVPAGSTIITVCGDYVDCFDAKMVGVELESRGHTFMGRYPTPWELK